MATFWITRGALPSFLKTKSRSTTAPDMTWPNSNRASGKTALGASEAALTPIREEDAKNAIALAAGEITNALPAQVFGEAEFAPRPRRTQRNARLVRRQIEAKLQNFVPV